MKRTYYVRYNVEHKNGISNYPWKVFETEDIFYLTKSVKINTTTWTNETPFIGGGVKYSIYCEGTMTSCTDLEVVIQ